MTKAIFTRLTEELEAGDNIIDLTWASHLCNEKRVSLHRCAIFDPDQVSIVPGEIVKTITLNFCDFNVEFKTFAEHSSAVILPAPLTQDCIY